jgi:multiple sugar transport system permease protein
VTVRRNAERGFGLLGVAVVWTYALSIAIPLYYLVASSSKVNAEIFRAPLAWPTTLTIDAYSRAMNVAGLGSALVNSAIVTAGALVITLALAVPASYGLARVSLKSVPKIEAAFGLGFLIPPFAVLIPAFLLSIRSGLYPSRLFVVIFYPSIVLPLAVILLTQFMKAIPVEIEESARVDGANRWRLLTSIYIPIAKPGIVTVVILSFMAFWNEFIFALVLLDNNGRTVQVALPGLAGGELIDYGRLAAGTLIASAPVFAMFALLRARMIEAFSDGAVKQ